MVSEVADPTRVYEVELLEPEFCARLIEAAKSLGFCAGGRSYVFPGAVANSNMAIMGCDKDHPVLNEMRATLTETLRALTHRDGEERFRLSPIRMISYGVGGVVAAHRDAKADFARWRSHTLLCYLNSDYTGGETYFPALDRKIVPEPGKAVIFPSYYLHQVLEVLEGEKFVLSVFLMDPIASLGQE